MLAIDSIHGKKKAVKEAVMANLSIRKLDDSVYERLQILAQEHAISMEEEVRQIIYKAVGTPVKMTDLIRECFGPKNGIDLEIVNERKPHEPMDFS